MNTTDELPKRTASRVAVRSAAWAVLLGVSLSAMTLHSPWIRAGAAVVALIALVALLRQRRASRRQLSGQRSTRIAVLMNLAPRKLGSFEAWIAAICEEARDRGYQLDVFGRAPVHGSFEVQLSALGAGWALVNELEASPLKGIRRLARYDVIHLNMVAPRSRLALMAYAAWPARVLLVDHTSGPAQLSPPRQAGSLRALVRRALDRVTALRIASIAGVSDYVSDRDRARFSVARDRVRTLYNGVDPYRFKPAIRAVRSVVTVLTVAHLIPEKGIDYLVRAFARLGDQEAQLVIAGDGPEMAKLQSLVRMLGLSHRVSFAGLRDDVPALIAECDIFVHPAIWAEAFGLTIAEAMSMAKPVIASRVGGIPELIEHRRSGWLVPPGQISGLANAMERLIADPPLRSHLGAAARLRVLERFSLQQSVIRHINWCESAIGIESTKASIGAPRPAADVG